MKIDIQESIKSFRPLKKFMSTQFNVEIIKKLKGTRIRISMINYNFFHKLV